MTKPKTTRPATAHITPFGLRMQPDLKEQLERAAHEAGRSLNAEIVSRLEESLAAHVLSPLDQKIMLDALNRALKEAIASGIVHPRLKGNGEPIDEKAD